LHVVAVNLTHRWPTAHVPSKVDGSTVAKSVEGSMAFSRATTKKPSTATASRRAMRMAEVPVDDPKFDADFS
jgi:hypothetical protein